MQEALARAQPAADAVVREAEHHVAERIAGDLALPDRHRGAVEDVRGGDAVDLEAEAAALDVDALELEVEGASVGGAETRQDDLVEALEPGDGGELGLELGRAEALLGAGDGQKGEGDRRGLGGCAAGEQRDGAAEGARQPGPALVVEVLDHHPGAHEASGERGVPRDMHGTLSTLPKCPMFSRMPRPGVRIGSGGAS